MPRLFQKRLKYYSKRCVLSSVVYFFLFCTLNILFCLTYSFFSHIYLFSDGFDNDLYYTTRLISSVKDQNESISNDACFLYGINSKVDGNTISYTGYIQNWSTKSENGLFISERVYYHLSTNQPISDKNGCYALSSTESAKQVSYNGKVYPVTGKITLTPTWNTKTILEFNGINHTDVTLIVDSSQSYSEINGNSSIVFKDNGENDYSNYYDVYKGSERNKQVKDGYNIYLPLFYVCFLVPFTFCTLSFTRIIAGMQKDSRNEIAVFRAFGRKRHNSFRLVMVERLLEVLASFLVSSFFFLPVYIFAYHFSIGATLIYSTITLLYVLLVVLLKSNSEVKKAYSQKGGLVL